jgi:hypothetical protein
MILKKGRLLIDLKYASSITVKDGYIIVSLIDRDDIIKVEYGKDWTPEVLTAIIVIRKNEDGFYIDLGGDGSGDSGKAD